MFNQHLDIHPEVLAALNSNKPVVALESTIISHGMPYPQNVAMAKEVENIIRSYGAVPATIAILHGKLKVGLNEEELELLATSHDIVKASRRDIGFLVASKGHGATTVASTMIIADLAGIKVFATGGIGGVHRGAETSFDISADLLELAQTSVAVVCAGAKSILDIGLTLEYLETHGVPVVGYQTQELPAFYTSKSGFGVDYQLDTPYDIALALKTKWDVGLQGGVVIANPIPKEFEMDYDVITNAISEALAQQETLGIKGKESTPFLLSKVKELTGGDSLASNIQLVYNNAHLAAQVAVELSKL
jgi:pseudouridylate synthase